MVMSLTNMEQFKCDDFASLDTESTRSSAAVMECVETKAIMASRVLRSLADSDYQRAWEQLRYEFECQKVLWGIAEMESTSEYSITEDRDDQRDTPRFSVLERSGLLGMCLVEQHSPTLCHGKTPQVLNPRRDGIISALKSKVEFALAMNSAGDANAIYALEALLILNDTMTKQLSAETPESRDSASSALSPSMRASAEEILELVPVRQARNDLADYCDEVAADIDARFTRSADWATTTVKACDLRHAVLKEYLSEIVAFDGHQRLVRQ
jgi:hypothetical protein